MHLSLCNLHNCSYSLPRHDDLQILHAHRLSVLSYASSWAKYSYIGSKGCDVMFSYFHMSLSLFFQSLFLPLLFFGDTGVFLRLFWFFIFFPVDCSQSSRPEKFFLRFLFFFSRLFSTKHFRILDTENGSQKNLFQPFLVSWFQHL